MNHTQTSAHSQNGHNTFLTTIDSCPKLRLTMDSICMFVILSVVLQSALAQTTPAITYISPKQVKDIGESVELQCSLSTNARDLNVLWSKNEEDGIIYISHGYALTVPDNRYSITENVTSRTFTLQIRHLLSRDAGIYQCILVIDRSDQRSANVELEIRQPAA